LIAQFKQAHRPNPEQDTNLEEFRNAEEKIIGIDHLGQVVSVTSLMSEQH